MPRSRIALLLAGLVLGLLATFAGPAVPPAHGQTGPRRTTPVVGAPGLPLATPEGGAPSAPATVVPAPPPPLAAGPVAPFGPLVADTGIPTTGQPAGAPPAAAPLAPAPQLDAPLPAPGQPVGPLPPGKPGGAGQPGAAGQPQPAAEVTAPSFAPPADPFAVAESFPLVAALVPAAGVSDRRGPAIVSSAAGAPVRVTVLVPPRDDGPSDVRVGAAGMNEWTGISLPGVTISRAFTVDVRRPDGALIELHPRPLTLAVAVENADVAAAGGDPSKLRILRWDPTRRVGIVLATVYDRGAGTLSATTDHTSLFLIAATPPGEVGEIAALLKAPWGEQVIPPGRLPARMPRVGSAAPALTLVPLALGAGGALAVVLCAWWPRRPRA